jgi:uncharacterized protein
MFKTNSETTSVVVDMTSSPHAVLHPIPATCVTIEDRFWQPRREVNRRVMIPAQYKLCEETGRMDNLRRAAGKLSGEFTGWFFNDSDVYKWIEAAAWQLTAGPDAELESLIDKLGDEIADAQQPDGYLNSYFMAERADRRWTDFDRHEMYCAGHLFQAAVAYYRLTGKTKLLDVSRRFADHICARFGTDDQGKHFGTDGHPEIEMALVELYRVTGEKKYLEQVDYFIDVRGSGRLGRPFGRFDSSYHQDHVPFRQLSRLEGHAVRAVYLNCGAADLYAETGDPALLTALDRMWDSMTRRQIYLNGGLGSRYEYEGFGPNYELPNGRAHAETCASVANVMWNWRMLLLRGESRYADMMELSLYNSVLAGVSLDGSAYYYQNPLSDDGNHRRERWFAVACCPSNVSRMLAQLPGYFYSTSEEGIWVHLYARSSVEVNLSGGATVHLTQRTDYPWSGDIEIETETIGMYALFLRVPGWCDGNYTLTVNGKPADGELLLNGYLKVSREWQAGDILNLRLLMDIRRIESHPYVTDNQGRVALMRGPVLYCVERADNSTFDVRLLKLSDAGALTATFVRDLLDGVTVLRGSATLLAADDAWNSALYRRVGSILDGETRHVEFMAIPYYAWANREPGPMQVWIRSR